MPASPFSDHSLFAEEQETSALYADLLRRYGGHLEGCRISEDGCTCEWSKVARILLPVEGEAS